MARPRWVLHMQAQMWRFLMGIGMLLHKIAPPRPPKPTFTRSIPSTVSTKAGHFDLVFYTPKDYETQRRLGFRDGKRKNSRIGSKGFPCVINFHGGGFTLGTATDDARWCGTVVDQCNAVVVSVDYRLAPECPFPTAVEDGVDAVLYMQSHADELGIDPDRIALSGFSSGGNMAFTVPLRLYDHQTEFGRTHDEETSSSNNSSNNHLGVLSGDATASSLSVNRILRSRSANIIPTTQTPAQQKVAAAKQREIGSTINLCAICPWYPSCDYTQTREQRRGTTVRKDQDLPALFTDLFDESYLHPPDTIPLDSPYLSPALAPTSLLREALPNEIVMFTCEWDMLLAEGQKLHERLKSEEVGKKVTYTMVPSVPHGWDKAPNPLKPTPGVREHYLAACRELDRVFREIGGVGAQAGSSGRRESRFVR